MKHNLKLVLQHIPWLLLLLGIDVFAALLLWLADVRSFYAMMAAILLATLLLFFALCAAIVRLERKREHDFLEFLHAPEAYQEQRLLETLGPVQKEQVRLLGKALRERQEAYVRLQEQWSDYEEYVESWAHEAKTPLSLLTLLLDNRGEEMPPEVRYKLDHIRSRLQESVDQMLFYARLKGARKDYLFEHVPIRACVQELLEDYGPLLEEKQFMVCQSLGDDTVYSDRRGLRFLLGQILSNSVKYCGEEPELAFTSFRRDGRYVLCIRDNGIGVRSCDLPYIFEKGFTGDSGEGRRKATGMGLYLAEGIAREMNLSLCAVSEWGKGFEMQVSFPEVLEER